MAAVAVVAVAAAVAAGEGCVGAAVQVTWREGKSSSSVHGGDGGGDGGRDGVLGTEEVSDVRGLQQLQYLREGEVVVLASKSLKSF